MNITRIYYNNFFDVVNHNNIRFYLYILNTELERNQKYILCMEYMFTNVSDAPVTSKSGCVQYRL